MKDIFIVAICVTVGLLIYGIIAIAFASQLGSPAETEQWLTDDNMLQQVREVELLCPR